jgi:hypothetical protein
MRPFSFGHRFLLIFVAAAIFISLILLC